MNNKNTAAAAVLFCKMTTKRKCPEHGKILFGGNKGLMYIQQSIVFHTLKRKRLTVILL